MNFLSLFNKLGKQPVSVNKQRISACLNAADMQKLCEGKADWQFVSIPLSLKFTHTKGEQPKMYFVHDNKSKK